MDIDLFYIASVLGIILVSMTVHEAMHGFMAYYLGDDTAKLQGRLTLNPIKHIDPFLTILLPLILALTPGAPIFGGAKPVPFNPSRVRHGEWGAALVALAGPLTNLFFAFIAFGIGVVTGVISAEGFVNSGFGTVIALSVYINLGFFIFNMIPLPPLDGSRVLYAVAPDGVRNVMEGIERMGIIFIFLIVILASSLIGSFMLGGIDLFVDVFSFIFGINA